MLPLSWRKMLRQINVFGGNLDWKLSQQGVALTLGSSSVILWWSAAFFVEGWYRELNIIDEGDA